MVDPLSAFAAAGVTLQFVELGIKLLKNASEVYRAKDGSLEEHSNLRLIVQNIQQSSIQIAQFSALNQSQTSKAAQNLKQANQECEQVSAEFLQLLNELKLDLNSISAWKAAVLAFRGLKIHGRISRIESKLTHARHNLMVSILIYLSLQNGNLHDDFLKTATETEKKVLHELQSTKSCLEGDIGSLAQSFASLDLSNNKICQVVERFRANNHVALDRLVNRVEATYTAQNHVLNGLAAKIDDLSAPWTVERIVSKATDAQRTEAAVLLLHSLDFCERNDRVSTIVAAYEQTFEWILSCKEAASDPWDDFVAWLEASNQKPIYWIQGKAGSGKSTLMAFLDQRLRVLRTSSSSAEPTANALVLQASCYFWHGGTKAQRSLGGLLQSLIYQICLVRPNALFETVRIQRQADAIMQATRKTMWINEGASGANSSSRGSTGLFPAQQAPWALLELKTCLKNLLQSPQALASLTDKSVKFLLLIDGLDEYEGTDEDHQSLISLLISFSHYPNVRICLSSRPWVIYKVSFNTFPQRRLEDLTRNDIEVFVDGKLRKDKFFQQMEIRSPNLITKVTTEINRKANGVFLWVRLVVHNVLKAVRDGCKIPWLLKLLDTLPPDLDELFMRMMRSVNPLYQDEASIFMQIALCKLDWQHEIVDDYREQIFFDGPPLDLLHLFGDETRPDFVTGASVQALDWSDQPKIRHWVAVLDRLLTSRCMGLLEWHGPDPLNPFCPRKISFLHRTVRDFLLTPTAQEILLQFSNGPYDAYLFRCNALVSDVMSLSNLPTCKKSHTNRLNHLSCFLGQITCRPSGEEMYALYETFVASLRLQEQDWKQLNKAVEDEPTMKAPDLLLNATADWQENQSTALSLAILFDWTDFVKARLAHDMISEKRGRPLLDYALIPCVRLSKNANPEIVAHLLSFGADPNEPYQGTSMWVRYILSLQDLNHCDRMSNITTIKALVQHGVDRFVKITELQAQPTNPVVRAMKTTTLLEILECYQTHHPTGLDEGAYDVLDVLEAISRTRHWVYAFQFETGDRTELENIWQGTSLRPSPGPSGRRSRKGKGKRRRA